MAKGGTGFPKPAAELELAAEPGRLNPKQATIDEKEITLYPNPISQYLQYELPENYLGKTVLFEVVDVQGRKLKSIKQNSLSGEIDLSNLNSGLYFVKIITNNKILIKTIFKN